MRALAVIVLCLALAACATPERRDAQVNLIGAAITLSPGR